MKQVVLLALVILCGAVAIKFYTAHVSHASGDGHETITPEEAQRRMDTNADAVILDVRTAEEYAAGHIPGAVCLPVEDIDADPAAAVLPDKDAEILVYCRSGRRSAMAAEALAGLGYTRVADFGGINGWPYDIVTD